MKKVFHNITERQKKIFFAFFAVLILISIGKIYYDIRHGEPKKILDRNFAGVIINIDEYNIFVQDRAGNVRSFYTSTDTDIFLGQKNSSFQNLTKGKFVIVEAYNPIDPNLKQIEAKNIRILENENKLKDLGN